MTTNSEIDEIDHLRAAEYGLLSLLLGKAPDADTLARVATLKGDGSDLGMAHVELANAAANADDRAVSKEFFDLFIGLGRGDVLPYASYYLTGFLHERPLARVREDLDRLGIERAGTSREPEDHVAILLEVMSGLARGDFEADFGEHAIPYAIAIARAWDARLDLVMCVVFAATFSQFVWQELSAAPLARAEPLNTRSAVIAQLEKTGSIPIVLTDIDFLQAWYYAPAEWRARLWYVADPDATLEAIGTGTIDRNLLVLARYAPVNVASYRSFVAHRHRFLVLSSRESGWLLRRLQSDGGVARLIGEDSSVPIYDVSF